MMSLYVSSHYKNSPNDLQLMSDAPAHHLFVLLGPRKENDDAEIPDILVVIQVAQEGTLEKQSISMNMIRGKRPNGDLIPWTITSQFQDNSFGRLSGLRIVRIATHPDVQRMKYGSTALKLLEEYYQGLIKITPNETNNKISSVSESNLLTQESLKPRKHLPPILTPINERTPEYVNYLGTSFGVTQPLFLFWKKGGFQTLYLRQTSNKTTGEHSIIMLKELAQSKYIEVGWLNKYTTDYRRRLMSLMSMAFRTFDAKFNLILLDPSQNLIDGSRKAKQMIFHMKN
eukprot:UN34179